MGIVPKILGHYPHLRLCAIAQVTPESDPDLRLTQLWLTDYIRPVLAKIPNKAIGCREKYASSPTTSPTRKPPPWWMGRPAFPCAWPSASC